MVKKLESKIGKSKKEIHSVYEWNRGWDEGVKHAGEKYEAKLSEIWDRAVAHGECIGYDKGWNAGFDAVTEGKELIPELKKIEYDRGFEQGHVDGWYDCLDSLQVEEKETGCVLPENPEDTACESYDEGFEAGMNYDAEIKVTQVQYRFPFIMTAFLYILSIFLLIKLFAFIYYGGDNVNYNYTPPEITWVNENIR